MSKETFEKVKVGDKVCWIDSCGFKSASDKSIKPCKICYENCEEKGEFEIQLLCDKSDEPRALQLIKEFCEDRNKRFYTSPHYIIEMLKTHNIEAEEIEYEKFYM